MPDDRESRSATDGLPARLHDGLSGLASRLGAGLGRVRAAVGHAGQHLRRTTGRRGPGPRRAVLASLGRTQSTAAPARLGETCEVSRTDDRHLPWRTFGWYGGWGGRAYRGDDAGTDRPPVVFVHGNGGDACNFAGVADHLHREGWPGDALWAITFGSFTPSHDAMRDQLEDFVGHVLAATGASQVDVVAHSLGVTGVRYWLAEHDRYDAVDRFVGLGGANHGVCVCPGCREAGPDGSGLFGAGDACRALARDCFDERDHPLAGLNEPDETPGDVEYVMVRGRFDSLYWCDRRSPSLDGATNVAVPAGHMGLLDRPSVVRRHLDS